MKYFKDKYYHLCYWLNPIMWERVALHLIKSHPGEKSCPNIFGTKYCVLLTVTEGPEQKKNLRNFFHSRRMQVGFSPGRCWEVQQCVNLQIPAINLSESALFNPTPELSADSLVSRKRCLTAARCRSCCSSDDQQSMFHSCQHFCKKAFSRQRGDVIYRVVGIPEAFRSPT